MMHTSEAAAVFDRLFTAFPQYREWLTGVDDPRATHAVWCEMLSGVDAKHAMKAVDRILDGRLAMPPAYERDHLPIKLRSYAHRIAQDESTAAAKDRERDTLRGLASERRSLSMSTKFAMEFRRIMERSRQAGYRLRDGEITREENDEIVAQCREDHRRLQSKEHVNVGA